MQEEKEEGLLPPSLVRNVGAEKEKNEMPTMYHPGKYSSPVVDHHICLLISHLIEGVGEDRFHRTDLELFMCRLVVDGEWVLKFVVNL